ncbi:MAG: cobyric acid synthase [Sulfurimonas sp.]|nr:cobyric acid synthase [Sulfurimonas sp.]MBU3938427.1 cobyric acid synthase [bacterium]MBU4025492.1 cobyric acid synthase [bacterium]MBU4059172.1 cobyric acid synthase [bacterium]MBU4111445.1 cobyric acid synthase [bacterium]
MKSLSIFGTSNDDGKSTIAFALTYILHKRGYKVAPFKAQSISENSQISDDGGEMAIPQHFAAEALGIKSSHLMNPVLLKRDSPTRTDLIIDGKSFGKKDIWSCYKDTQILKPYVKNAFSKLLAEYECVVAEGAGNPVEQSYMKRDLSNIYIAEEFHTKIILVTSIDDGTLFSSIYGVYKLLPKKLRKNVIGVIVDKFQNNVPEVEDGASIIEQLFGMRVLGVVPHKELNSGFHDLKSMMAYQQDTSAAIITVGVLKLPHISNITDFEPLIADKEIELRFITGLHEASFCDLLILPGSKLVAEDLEWLIDGGFKNILTSKEQKLVAISGGYEMLHEFILDPHGVESQHKKVPGLARVEGNIELKKKTFTKKGLYSIFGCKLEGYEIHNAITKEVAVKKRNLYATHVHGIFENSKFRNKLFRSINPEYKGYDYEAHKQKVIEEFAAHIESSVNIEAIEKELI